MLAILHCITLKPAISLPAINHCITLKPAISLPAITALPSNLPFHCLQSITVLPSNQPFHCLQSITALPSSTKQNVVPGSKPNLLSNTRNPAGHNYCRVFSSRYLRMNSFKSPSSTAWVSEVSHPVLKSLTILYGWST